MCKVEILDKTHTCPLCQNVLNNQTEGRSIYPDARIATRKYRFLENMVLFASIVLWILLVVIDYMVIPGLAWSLVGGLVLIYSNIMLRLTILGRQTYMTKILWSILIGLACLICADYATGYHAWAFNFALPSAIAVWDIALVLLMLFINPRNWQSYIIDQLTALVACGVMLFCILIKVITFPYYAIGVGIFTVLIFLGTLIIGDRKARAELKRRFHL